MAHALSEETLLEIDDMLDDIQSLRDVGPDSVTRAIKVLLQEVRRLRDEQREAPLTDLIDERLPVDQPGVVSLDDSTHPTRPPF